jgi:hypothetical protein
MAIMFAGELLTLHNMRPGAAAEFDYAQPPPSSEAEIRSRACHSCLVHWVINTSMDAVNDRKTMAHCHTCLQLEAVASPPPTDMFVMAEYALASRLLGEFIYSPVVHKFDREVGDCFDRGCRSKQPSSAQASAAPTLVKSAANSRTTKTAPAPAAAAGSRMAAVNIGKQASSAQAPAMPAPIKSAAKGRTTNAAPAADADADADAGSRAACDRCLDHIITRYNKKGEGSQQVPKRMRRDCAVCLEANMVQHASYYYGIDNLFSDGDAEDDINDADMQAIVAETLSHALFKDKGVPYSQRATVDVSQLQSGSSITSNTCSSCIRHWVLKSSMAVAQDHDLVVHCHMCLHELDAEKATQPTKARPFQHIIWFAVASRYVGKFVACPLMRIMSKDGLADKKDAAFAAHLKVLSGVDRGKTRRAADDARRRSSSKADKQSLPVLEAVQYGFDDGATWLFSWVDSAWFQAWGAALVVLALVLMLFVDWWVSAHESHLHGCARRLGLLGRNAPATPAPEPKGKKAATSGASSAAAKKQQQQQGKGGKKGKKRQAGKADSKGRSNHSGSSSSRSQAPSREQSSEAGTNSSRDHNANIPPWQQGSRALSEDSEWEVQLRPLQQEQQQQRQQQPVPPSSSSAEPATAQHTVAAVPGKGELRRACVPQQLYQGCM